MKVQNLTESLPTKYPFLVLDVNREVCLVTRINDFKSIGIIHFDGYGDAETKIIDLSNKNIEINVNDFEKVFKFLQVLEYVILPAGAIIKIENE
jgi:hypothetical protein